MLKEIVMRWFKRREPEKPLPPSALLDADKRMEDANALIDSAIRQIAEKLHPGSFSYGPGMAKATVGTITMTGGDAPPIIIKLAGDSINLYMYLSHPLAEKSFIQRFVDVDWKDPDIDKAATELSNMAVRDLAKIGRRFRRC